ncbi:DUF397 domain-containing protein [Streptomyces sp. NPDC048288]|uniref:DUF397 domain-containing protein n=1 Tax=Streptomyces sp. NPDC048288 TaxID=3365529 RepID=UPI0037149097
MITPVDSPVKWRKSSRSAQGNCVEVAFSGGVLVRDSKDPECGVLNFSAISWNSFLNSGHSAPRAAQL